MELGRLVFILNRGVIQSSNPLAQGNFSVEVQAHGMQEFTLFESMALAATLTTTSTKILTNILAAHGKTPNNGVKGAA